MGGPSGPFWKYDRTAETAMSEGRSILGGLWTSGKLDRLVIRDARYSVGWFDALAHEGVHILSGTVLWPVKLFINNNPSGRFFFGWVRFAEEIAAYNTGRLAVGRIHGMGPLAIRDAVRSLRATDSMFALRSAGFALPFEIALGYYLLQKFRDHR